ncbi:GNAT family N-acetyltransferase [Vallitalea sp.]|jgi:ribosomal protein S18 acetylase RimI-like enzyme|uniref:GNAT family N-acetyltransferase n=1 Tax=Vallitalea sp. TaxID=1882829 RepID=UPI0025FB7167|nr:GNAT family N-acetyltransferase [Vallitalea sp.]MCT4687018.1 GNAT family N-acetyltransferase [Vallitalea sp.]
MKIRRLEERDVIDVADLAMRTFRRYNSLDFYDEEAITKTLDYFDPTKNTKQQLLDKFSKKPIFYVAEEDEIVGMICGMANRISSLFVDGTQHRSGIGKKLLERFEIEAKEYNSNYISIEASLYAVAFYQKMGFNKTTGICNHMGLKVYKMEKVL